ncbi:unnamed protein product, partial [Brassica rapa]
LCVLNTQPTRAEITRTVHKKGQRAESKDQRADMCNDGQPRTSYTHRHTRTATNVLCVLTDTHGQPRTSCPTWDKITQTVHGKGQRAESKDQRADMCTEGQPRTSCVPRGPKLPEQSTGRVSMRSQRTNVLICVLMDSHRHHVCADGHTRTHTHSHYSPLQRTWAKITQTVHGKGQRAESKDQHQRADMCTDGQPLTSCTDVLCVLTDSHGRPVQPTWAKITQTVHGEGHRAESKDQRADIMLSPRTNVLICVLMDSHGHPVCADGHRRTPTDSHTRPVCAEGHTRTSSTDVMCVLADTHRRPVCTEQTAHPTWPISPRQSTGRVSMLSPRTNVLTCVLMDSHGRPVCADGNTRTHTDSHRRPVCADGHTRTSSTAHVGQNHPNSPRGGSL